jgi:hypothetical protein
MKRFARCAVPAPKHCLEVSRNQTCVCMCVGVGAGGGGVLCMWADSGECVGVAVCVYWGLYVGVSS